MVRLTDRPDMTLDVYRGPKTSTTISPGYQLKLDFSWFPSELRSIDKWDPLFCILCFYHIMTFVLSKVCHFGFSAKIPNN